MKLHRFFAGLRLIYVSGLICFAIHLGLTLFHTYFSASERNTRAFPHVTGTFQPERWHNFLDLNRWDSAHYERIVLQGYRNPDDPKRPLNTIGWFPGYPLVAKGIYAITRWKVSFIFSLLSTFFTLVFWLLLWTPRMLSTFGAKVLAATSALILCWPGAFFWFAGMTEPLVGLLMLLLVYLWLSQRFGWIVIVLGYGTAVKQVFVPLTVAMLTLDAIKNRLSSLSILVKSLIALTGFIAFGAYSWINFGNFLMSSEVAAATYQKKLTLFSLVDLNNYAKLLSTHGGLTAFLSMQFLLIEGSRIIPSYWKEWRKAISFQEAAPSLPVDLVLWWLGLTCTAFFIFGDAYSIPPFGSIMRYQTSDIPIFLLLGSRFRTLDSWRVRLLLLPTLWVSLYWQNHFAVVYWNWAWVA